MQNLQSVGGPEISIPLRIKPKCLQLVTNHTEANLTCDKVKMFLPIIIREICQACSSVVRKVNKTCSTIIREVHTSARKKQAPRIETRDERPLCGVATAVAAEV